MPAAETAVLIASGAPDGVPDEPVRRGLLTRLPVRRRTVYLGILLVLLAIFAGCFAVRLSSVGTGTPVPSEMAVDRLHGLDFSATIRPRPVSYTWMPTGDRDWLVDTFAGGWTVFGSYNALTGRMVLNDMMLDEGQENLNTVVLRHEYGHVLFDDVVSDAAGPGLAGDAYAYYILCSARLAGRNALGRAVASTWPGELRDAYGAYAEGRDYGTFSLSVGEYWAESYSYLLTGNDIEPRMQAVLARYAESVPQPAR